MKPKMYFLTRTLLLTIVNLLFNYYSMCKYKTHKIHCVCIASTNTIHVYCTAYIINV